MAKILGTVSFDPWERKVRTELSKQLPNNWVVVCNVSYCWQNEDGYTRDGQADFVVLAPNLGMTIVEVKGAKSIWVDDSGIWHRRRWGRQNTTTQHQMQEPPPEQATRNMHNLALKISTELGSGSFPGLFAWLVAFPNGEVEGKLDLYYENSVVDKRSIHQFRKAIESVLKDRENTRLGERFTEDVCEKASKILTNSNFIVRSVDTDLDVVGDIKDIDELTQQQFSALRGAFELPSISISGPAGSGKTLLAIWKLQALLTMGKRAIYVCFNTRLAAFLQNKYPDMSESIVSVDGFFVKLTNGPFKTGSEYFTQKLPESVLIHSMDMDENEKYESIIVDEGQDFKGSRLTALKYLLKDKDAQWLIFSDQNQDLYQGGNEAITETEVTFRLYENCRNTKRLNDATNTVCNVEFPSMKGVPEGEHPQVSVCKSELMAQKAWSLAHDLRPEGGSVILSPFTLKKSCMKDSPKGYGLTLTEDIEKLGLPNYIFFSTVKSFKGLEATHVILVHADLPDISIAFAKEDLYVAFTRATTRLDIITTDDEAEAWYQTALQKLK